MADEKKDEAAEPEKVTETAAAPRPADTDDTSGPVVLYDVDNPTHSSQCAGETVDQERCSNTVAYSTEPYTPHQLTVWCSKHRKAALAKKK